MLAGCDRACGWRRSAAGVHVTLLCGALPDEEPCWQNTVQEGVSFDTVVWPQQYWQARIPRRML